MPFYPDAMNVEYSDKFYHMLGMSPPRSEDEVLCSLREAARDMLFAWVEDSRARDDCPYEYVRAATLVRRDSSGYEIASGPHGKSDTTVRGGGG